MPFDASTSFFGDFPGFSDGMCLSEPGGFFMSGDFANHAAAVRQFRPRPDDVWVVTFAKCGGRSKSGRSTTVGLINEDIAQERRGRRRWCG